MPKTEDKPFVIPKPMVWEAWRRVKANKGAPGVDGQDLEAFEADLADNLYKVWNRMSSGSYFPPPVKAVEIPKPRGAGVRVLGVPTIADRVAQTVVAMHLGVRAEPRFHPDSYGFRPRKSAHDAIAACRERCWKYDWVIDLDVQKFFDEVPWDLVVRGLLRVQRTRLVTSVVVVAGDCTVGLRQPPVRARQSSRACVNAHVPERAAVRTAHRRTVRGHERASFASWMTRPPLARSASCGSSVSTPTPAGSTSCCSTEMAQHERP
jgi:hypothetical protein